MTASNSDRRQTRVLEQKHNSASGPPRSIRQYCGALEAAFSLVTVNSLLAAALGGPSSRRRRVDRRSRPMWSNGTLLVMQSWASSLNWS